MSRNDFKLAADVEGRVEWVAEVGTVVKKGDVVARLDSNMAQMQRDSDKANVARLDGGGEVRSRARRAHAGTARCEGRCRRPAADQAISTRDSNEAALAAGASGAEAFADITSITPTSARRSAAASSRA